MIRILTGTIVGIWLLAAPALSLACRPMVRDVSDYVGNRIPNHVIFVGKVISVNSVTESSDLTSVYDISFVPARWFSGDKSVRVTVRGVVGSMSGTECPGLFDFSAKIGEEWLIFGQLHEGRVNPDVFQSKRIVGGKLPEEARAELERAGIIF